MSGLIRFVCMLLIIAGAPHPALSGTADIAGKWIVRWDGNAKNENALSLGIRNRRISGTYINDRNASCTVTGNLSDKRGQFSLTVVCPDWDIRMQGNVSADWKSASGDYQAYVASEGKFAMRKTP